MPVDLNRVPPRVEVPPAPQPSMIVWAILLVLVMGAGAALTILLWSPGRPTSRVWFWLCAVVYPFLAWAFILFAWLGYRYVCRNQAIAVNRVSDEAEERSHEVASQPLSILGHAWCFSADESENALDGVRNGTVQIKTRASAAVDNTDVNARWLVVPDSSIPPGNELDEHDRHQTLCSWLLERLIERLDPQLMALPPQTKIQAELYLCPTLDAVTVETQLRKLLAARMPGVTPEVVSKVDAIPLFRADAWLDQRKSNTAHLLIAVELRDAISTVLADGAAEAGTALLIGHPRPTSPSTRSAVRLHRPAKDTFDAAARTLELATRWGHSPRDRQLTVWTHGLTSEKTSAVRQAASFRDATRWIALETSVGDCAGAGPWLAVALAAENARTTGDPQMVLCGEGNELTALMCGEQT